MKRWGGCCTVGVGMTLDNKCGITEKAELAREEERLSKIRALGLFESGELDSLEPGAFAALSHIYERLFGDVHPFAGQLRTQNIAKGGFRFALVSYLEASLRDIEAMPQTTFDQVVEKYVEMNVAHPFREGDGRSMRIWLDGMLKSALGSRVGKQDYLLAMERSPIKDVEIKVLLKGALTDRADDCAVYMKGIDASYHYEGYNAYRTEDLAAR